MVQALNLTKSNPTSTPGEDPQKEEESVLLDKDKVSGYRQLVARANYMAQERADIQCAVKEVCRGMASPTSSMHSCVRPAPHSEKRAPRHDVSCSPCALNFAKVLCVFHAETFSESDEEELNQNIFDDASPGHVHELPAWRQSGGVLDGRRNGPSGTELLLCTGLLCESLLPITPFWGPSAPRGCLPVPLGLIGQTQPAKRQAP